MTRDTAAQWYRQARHDLEMAEKNISIGGFDVAEITVWGILSGLAGPKA